MHGSSARDADDGSQTPERTPVGAAAAGAGPTPGAPPAFDITPLPDDLPPVRSGLEAVLLVVDEPVEEVTLAQVVERPRDEVRATLLALAAEYDDAGRGFELREVAGGWRLYTRAACAPYVERFVLEGQQARLTQAALETLAIIAYRQPVSRSRIAAVRAVSVDGVVRTLLTRGLIEETGTEPVTGAVLYGTTRYFLERLGLPSLEDLPPVADHLPDPQSLDLDDVSTSS